MRAQTFFTEINMSLKASEYKKCPVCNRRRGKMPGSVWWGHVNSCLQFEEKYGNGCNCGKFEADFPSRRSFVQHAIHCGLKAKKAPKKSDAPKVSKKKKTHVCKTCGAEFTSAKALRSHTWIHDGPSFGGGEWGDKDAVRAALQTIAAQRLKRLPEKNRVAICLPGERPDHEQALLSNPTFGEIYMVERIRGVCEDGRRKGFDIIHDDFVNVLRDLVNTGKRLALIDYDLCGSLMYSEGAALINTIRLGGLADIAVIRVTCCRRNTRRDGEKDALMLNEEIEFALRGGYAIVGRDSHRYVGRDRSAMATYQWIVEKGA